MRGSEYLRHRHHIHGMEMHVKLMAVNTKQQPRVIRPVYAPWKAVTWGDSDTHSRGHLYISGAADWNICPVPGKTVHLRLHVLINNSWRKLPVTFNIMLSWGREKEGWNCISFCKAKTAQSVASSKIWYLNRSVRNQIVQFGTKSGWSYWKAHASESAKSLARTAKLFQHPILILC